MHRVLLTAQPTTERWPGFMLRGARSLAAAALLVLIAASAGCASRPTSLTVPMVLQQTNDYRPTTLVGHSLKVYVQPIHDLRTVTDRIGENRENPVVVPILPGGATPPVWLADSLASELRQSGVNVVSDPAAADRQLSVNLSQFWVQESPDYHAQISISVQVLDSGGKVLWGGSAAGDDSTFGRSLSVENYQQVMSNAAIKLVVNLVSNPGFAQAVTSPPG